MITNSRSITQGQAANYTGDQAERTIECMLQERRVNFARQYPVRNIYGTPCAADFMLWDVPGYPDGLIIESKWQMVGGSVDEKYPYLVANIKEAYPAPAIIIMDGGGARAGSIKWCRSKVDGIRLIGVMTLGEFLNWVMRTL